MYLHTYIYTHISIHIYHNIFTYIYMYVLHGHACTIKSRTKDIYKKRIYVCVQEN